MEQTQSSKILYTKEVELLVNGFRTSVADLKGEAIESLDDLLQVHGMQFPFKISFDEAVLHPIVVLHSSGSTGLPKPVTMRHGSFAVMDNDRKFPKVPGRKNHDLTVWDFDGAVGRIYEPFPPFHLAGFFNKIMIPLYTNAIPIFGPPARPASGALVAEIMQQQKLRGCLLPPSVAEKLLHESNGLEFFKQLDVFCYAGGPLSASTGDAISKVTTVCQFYGSTELGQVRQLVPRREDWSYMEFHPYTELQFQKSDDGAFELVVFADSRNEDTVALNYNYPGLKEWRTKDLFKPHSSKPNLWRFHGRKDDIIVLSNGEKLNPVPMENHLQGLPFIAGAVVTGQARFQPALLIESKPTGNTVQDFMDKLWAEVEKANKEAPGYGRIVRSMILLAKSEKPFVRAGKGTIVRKLTETAYAEEIAGLYANTIQHHSGKPASLTATAFRSDAINSLIRSILPESMPVSELGKTDNFYNFGLDSLKSMEALEALKCSLLSHRSAAELSWLSLDTFYNNPTIEQLSKTVLAFLNDGTIPGETSHVPEMTRILEDFAGSLLQSQHPSTGIFTGDKISIALTGSTGSLGTHLLEVLSNHPEVSKIYCLNRSSTAEEQWEDVLTRRHLDRLSGSVTITFLTVKFGLSSLGLDHHSFVGLTNECDLIIHAAWKVDFNQSLSSFTDNIRSVQTLANWSAVSPRRPRLIFLSSISSVGPWNSHFAETSDIPEASVIDLGASLNIGYGESKQVAERLLDRAAAQYGAPVSILRVGQIGGPTASTHAKWTERELVPSMLKTSKAIGLIPTDLPPVDWIPVNVLSNIVAELAFHDLRNPSGSAKYYNVVNPSPVPWNDFFQCLKGYCGPSAKFVPLSEWVAKLETYKRTESAEISTKPALKMLNFFALMASRGPVARYQTAASEQASKTMGALQPVSQSLMQTWLEQCV